MYVCMYVCMFIVCLHACMCVAKSKVGFGAKLMSTVAGDPIATGIDTAACVKAKRPARSRRHSRQWGRSPLPAVPRGDVISCARTP